MTKEQKEKRLKERLRAEYQTCLRILQEKLPPDLTDQAAEIAVEVLVYQELKKGRSREFVDYLLRFGTPSEMIRDLCPDGQDHSRREDFAGRTVREFLQQHPEGPVGMMTPEGFVDLDAGQIKGLLDGGSVKGNPGCGGMDVDIQAAELLEQVICDCYPADGAWHMLTDTARTDQEEGMVADIC